MSVAKAAGAERAPRRSGTVLARSISVLAGSQLVTWCAALLWTLVVPRALGPTETGLYFLAVAAGGVLTALIGLGMRPLLVREIADDPARASRLISSAVALRILVAAPMLPAVVLFSHLGHFDGAQSIALCLGWGMCFFYLLYEPIQAAFQAIERMQYLAYADMLTKGCVSVGAVVLVVVGVRALGLLVGSAVVMGLVLGLNLVWMRRHLTVRWRVSGRDLASLLLDSLPYWGFAAFFTIYLWIDSLMLAMMTSSTVLGWYGMPTKVFGTLMSLPVIVSTALLPRLVVAFKDGTDSLWDAARSPLEVVLAFSIPLCVGTILIAEPLVALLYGPRFAESVPVFQVLALCLPAMYLNVMVSDVLVAAGRQMVYTRAMILAAILNPVLNLVLIPQFQTSRHNGAIGAALSLLITEVVVVGIGAYAVRGAFGLTSAMRLVRTVLATAGMTVAVLGARRLGLAAELAAGVVTFLLLALWFRVLTAGELRQLTAGVGRIVSRVRPRTIAT